MKYRKPPALVDLWGYGVRKSGGSSRNFREKRVWELNGTPETSCNPTSLTFLPFLRGRCSLMTYILLVLLSALLSLPAYLAQDDDFSLSLPFTSATENFDTFGSTTLHSDTIVLTPHSPSHMVGAIWAKRPNPHAYWEAEFSFRVSGGERGGTGLAFWYAAKRGLGGPVFGNADQWDGLALFFDGNTGAKVCRKGGRNNISLRYEDT